MLPSCVYSVASRIDERADEQDPVDRRVAVANSLAQVKAPENRARRLFGGLVHFSGTRMPSRPVGLKTRTPIRMPKITTSVHLEPM